MNKLSTAKRAAVVRCLVEGVSMRATARMTGVARQTINDLLVDLGRACDTYQDRVLRNLKCRRIECDEIWSFIRMKEKNVPAPMRGTLGFGDVWCWTAIDADTKLVPTWSVADRSAPAAHAFMRDLASRLSGRVQLTTDGLKHYLVAVDLAFGTDVDFAQLVKQYGPDANAEQVRYSPARCLGAAKHVVCGDPHLALISTSYVERANLTMRMGMRRFTRLTNAHSKKLENHQAAIALHFMHYNFARINQALRVTPAMAAGVTDHLWEVEEIVGLLDEESESKAA